MTGGVGVLFGHQEERAQDEDEDEGLSHAPLSGAVETGTAPNNRILDPVSDQPREAGQTLGAGSECFSSGAERIMMRLK
jgi:hypothetical protein